VLVPPHFWRRRRVTLPAREPLEGAGFDILEDRPPQLTVPAVSAGERRGGAQHRVRAWFSRSAGVATVSIYTVEASGITYTGHFTSWFGGM
jgi:hypothetical protein